LLEQQQWRLLPQPSLPAHHHNNPIHFELATHLTIAFVTTRALPVSNSHVELFLEAYCKHGGRAFLLCGFHLRCGSQSLYASIQYTPYSRQQWTTGTRAFSRHGHAAQLTLGFEIGSEVDGCWVDGSVEEVVRRVCWAAAAPLSSKELLSPISILMIACCCLW